MLLLLLSSFKLKKLNEQVLSRLHKTSEPEVVSAPAAKPMFSRRSGGVRRRRVGADRALESDSEPDEHQSESSDESDSSQDDDNAAPSEDELRVQRALAAVRSRQKKRRRR